MKRDPLLSDLMFMNFIDRIEYFYSFGRKEIFQRRRKPNLCFVYGLKNILRLNRNNILHIFPKKFHIIWIYITLNRTVFRIFRNLMERIILIAPYILQVTVTINIMFQRPGLVMKETTTFPCRLFPRQAAMRSFPDYILAGTVNISTRDIGVMYMVHFFKPVWSEHDLCVTIPEFCFVTVLDII